VEAPSNPLKNFGSEGMKGERELPRKSRIEVK
jgi:hypothetical protein